MSKIIGVTVGTPTSPKRIAKEIIPEVTPEDNGKVLIVNDGDWTVGALPNNLRATLHITLKANAWADGKQTIENNAVSENCTLVVNPTEGSKDAYIASVIELTEAEVGKMVFTCVTVPTEDIEVLVHVVGSLVEVEGAPDFIYANSKEELPADAKEGAIAFVPSEGESGGTWERFVPTTALKAGDMIPISDTEIAILEKAAAKEENLWMYLYYEDLGIPLPILVPLAYSNNEGMIIYSGQHLTAVYIYVYSAEDETWGGQLMLSGSQG